MSWNTHIQWKGTDVCIDIICPKCGNQDHIDADFCYFVRCESCKTTWRLGTEVSLTKTDDAWEGCTYSLHPDGQEVTDEECKTHGLAHWTNYYQQAKKELLRLGMSPELIAKL